MIFKNTITYYKILNIQNLKKTIFLNLSISYRFWLIKLIKKNLAVYVRLMSDYGRSMADYGRSMADQWPILTVVIIRDRSR